MKTIYNGGSPVGFCWNENLGNVFLVALARVSEKRRAEIVATVEIGLLVNLIAISDAPVIEAKS